MANQYKRKRISNAAELDLEEAKIRKKLRKIEQEWADILHPQQLAMGFLTNFITRRLQRKKTAKPSVVVAGKEGLVTAQPKEKRSGQGFKKALKIAGVSLLAALAIKKILKKRKRTQPAVQVAV